MKQRNRNAFYLALALAFSTLTGSAFADPSATTTPAATSSQSVSPANPAGAAPAAGQEGMVNINTATAEVLAKEMNGIGLKKAQAIVSYREQYGPFSKIEDLKQVPGIGNGLLERNRDHLSL